MKPKYTPPPTPPACVDCEFYASGNQHCLHKAARTWKPVEGWVTVPAHGARHDKDKCGLMGRLFEKHTEKWLADNWPLVVFLGLVLGIMWVCSR